MNIAIIDDLKTDSDRLVGLINTYMEQHRLQCRTMDLFSSGEAFLDTFTSGKYHLIFLDIYMDAITGMETANGSGRRTMTAGSSLSPPLRSLPWRATM